MPEIDGARQERLQSNLLNINEPKMSFLVQLLEVISFFNYGGSGILIRSILKLQFKKNTNCIVIISYIINDINLLTSVDFNINKPKISLCRILWRKMIQ